MLQLFRTNKWIRLTAIIIVFLAVGAGAFLLGRQDGQKSLASQIEQTTQEKHEGGYRFINPLLECETPASYGNTMTRLEDKLEYSISLAVRQKRASHISVYLRDLNNGPWIGINEEEKFSPASLMKVPVLISYLKLSESDPGLLQKKLKVTMLKEDIMPQNIVPQEEVETGREYTVDELLERMIKFSDNLAANTLLANADLNQLESIYADLGIKLPGMNAENFITVRDYAAFFRILFNSSYLNRESSERALYMLSSTSFRKGIVAGVPSYVNVAHKFGERRLSDSIQLHDCGIIYRADHPYLLCIMTRGNDFESMESIISEISRLAFEGFESE